MSLISLIVLLVIVGLLLWVVTTFVPMPEPYKRALVAIVVVVLVIWILTRITGVGDVRL